MMLSSKCVALVIVFCFTPDLVRFPSRETTGKNGQLGKVQLIAVWVVSIFMLGLALLTWLPCARRRLSIRCWEVLWTGILLVAVMGALAEGYYDLHDLNDPHPCSQNKTERPCTLVVKARLEVKERVALSLAGLAAVSHIVLPIRWVIMVPLDAFITVLFLVLVYAHTLYSESHSESRETPNYLPPMMILLVGSANVGLWRQEWHDRNAFQLLTDETVLRARAESSAQSVSLSSGPTTFGRTRGSDDASGVVSTGSVPATTLTGQV